MTVQELLQYQLHDAGRQLDKILAGVNDSNIDKRSSEHSMSPRETLVHLCECYLACSKSAEAIEHEWGTFRLDGLSTAGLKAKFAEMREEAIGKIDYADDEAIKHAHSFIVAHDFYHVGQLVTVRIGDGSGFDPYCIYSG